MNRTFAIVTAVIMALVVVAEMLLIIFRPSLWLSSLLTALAAAGVAVLALSEYRVAHSQTPPRRSR